MLITQFDKFVNRSTQEILGSEIERENLEPMLSTDIRNGGSVTGVKGNAEIYYRTGNVNLTPADLGALDTDNVYNGLDETAEGYALDARQGNVLNEAISGKLDKANVYNGLDKTAAGYALDARQGKVLADKLDATQSDIAIIIEGNQTTHTGGVAVGEYVIVRNSTISDIDDGLYEAVQAIPANTAITSAYLAAVSGGGLNAIQQSLAIEEINAGTGMVAYKFQGFILLMSVGNGPAIPSTGLPMPAALKPDTYTFATAAVYTDNDWYTQDRWVELRADTGYLAAHNKSAWISTLYTRFVMIYKAAN